MVVRDGATLYTIEGVAAALLMIVTATIVFQAISIYTPGDTHIDDMLLEQLGADALAVLDLPAGIDPGTPTQLEMILFTGDASGFHTAFSPHLQRRSYAADDPIQYVATISYRVGDEVKTMPFASSAHYTNRDPAVRVTRLVHLDRNHGLVSPTLPDIQRDRVQVVLLEVILWRG